jgi:hypothetical protein
LRKKRKEHEHSPNNITEKEHRLTVEPVYHRTRYHANSAGTPNAKNPDTAVLLPVCRYTTSAKVKSSCSWQAGKNLAQPQISEGSIIQ